MVLEKKLQYSRHSYLKMAHKYCKKVNIVLLFKVYHMNTNYDADSVQQQILILMKNEQ